ncbi:MAG: carboxypeptidase regulatory-like domain-containing protein [Acidobacteria bacterium]|nr:carboxypeptidase regulatory-like domain-containing protein [Acidobacteriota bacterium]MCW5949680.1 carboxypeptidase regulatory-like domain-containing protein [Pyrinomonadaceae bacterium]
MKKAALLRGWLTFIALAVAMASTGFAQTGSTSVSGGVTDQQGAVIAGATVKLLDPEKGFSRTATTSGSGTFSFSNVPPGVYTIEVEANGFKKLVLSNVQALVDKPTTVSINMEVGAVTEVVNVAGGELESIVNKTEGSLGNNFVSRQIQELPLEGRNVGDLLSLQPGVTLDGSVTGSRSDQANITLDGVDVNDQQNGTAFTPVLRVTPDSVDEFRVTTTNADSARGRSSGAQISLSTKSGTNEFHGALYEYHRNTVTTANDFFNNQNGVERPKLIRNLFGGRIGGPVVKNRFFFFYNYEGLREARETGVTQIVPLASLGQGSVKFRSNTGVVTTLTAAQINALTTNGQPGGTPVVDVNPASLAVLASAASRYRANDFTVGDGLNTAGFRFNAKVPSSNNTHTARIDWKVTRDEKHTVSFRGIFQDDYFDGVQAFPDTSASRRISRPFGTVASHTWLISNNLINNFRWGFTRQKFKDTGDSTGDAISFRGVFSPANYAFPFTRRTDTQNFVDDFTWIKGDHTLQFGGNIRIVRNFRSDESRTHDRAIINRSFFAGSGNVLTNPILNTQNPNTGSNYTIASSDVLSTRDAMAAVLGRYSQYTFYSNYQANGQRLPLGQPVIRRFATEEYDMYVQDAWRIRKNLNLTFGVRYGLSRPVYETQGYQAKPTIGLEEYLRRRINASNAGQNYGIVDSEKIVVDLAGPKNGKGNVYPWDTNNFQPNVAVAWSPNFKSGFLKNLFGANSASVFRGGFRITNDYFGQALAVNFDSNNTLGFASQLGISANTFNVSTNPGPLFTGFSQSVRSLPLPPGGSIANQIVFPQAQPLDDQRRIEGSLDSNLVSPINYQWNVTYGRELPGKLYVEVSYIGRLARHLLASRDIMTPNNIKDPASGQTWYQAATILEEYRRRRTPVGQIPNLPFFENMFPAGSLDALLFGAGLSNTRAAYGFMATDDTPGCVGAPLFGCYEVGNDWTYLQDVLDQYMPSFGGRRLFYNRQYGALSAYGTIAGSDYHGMTASIRQRYKGLTWDLNYTFAKSIDDASGVQTSGVYGSAFILNALRQRDNRAVSDFDVRHIINVNGVFELPFGRGKTFLRNMSRPLDAVFGGWQLSSIFRFNTGYPITDGMVDVAGWPTNWNVRSYVARIRPISSSPTKNGGSNPGKVPNLFSNLTAAYQSFRVANPGETGDRNQLRYPSYIVLDLGIAKTFKTPWNEKHKIQIRADGFNVTNTQRFTAADTIFGLDPYRDTPSSTFGNFSSIQGSPRVFQFAIRYDF